VEPHPVEPPAPGPVPDAVVLLAKGGYGDWPEQELAGMLDAVRATGRYAQVEGAFIDSGSPALPATLRTLGERGARRVLIAPVFVPVDRSLGQWLPKMVRRALKKHHLDRMQVVLAGPLGTHPATRNAVVRTLADAEQGPDVRQGAPRDVADQWLKPPAHAYHAFVCEGPRCATLGSHELFVHLRERLSARGLAVAENENGCGRGVLAVRTSCLYPCNLGPLMVVYPDACWYGALSETAIDQIVDEHFGAGRPVEARRRFRPQAAIRPDG
jgi:(2Fe-2S) ferredoxin